MDITYGFGILEVDNKEINLLKILDKDTFEVLDEVLRHVDGADEREMTLDAARSDGYDDGYNDGYEASYEEGFDDGKCAGYDEGYTTCIDDYDITIKDEK